MQVRKTWKQVDGVLLLDKPLGLTSNDALQKVRRLFSAAKGGHTGTLDPLASGLLPLCFGEATKFSADLLDADKTYEAVIQLGVTTDSGDAEGKVTKTAAVNVEIDDILRVLSQFTDAIRQIPPMHSALKRNGLNHLMRAVDEAHAAAYAKLPTPKLTRALLEAVQRQQPPRAKGGRPKPRYAHQGGSNPPVIVIHGNALEDIGESYRRYLEGYFRDTFNLAGTPLRVEFRTKANPYVDEQKKR